MRLSIYREVREEFRERWSDIYAARRNGADITELKAELLADQKAVLEGRRDEGCKELRETQRWARLVQLKGWAKSDPTLLFILSESDESTRIFAASIKTAQQQCAC